MIWLPLVLSVLTGCYLALGIFGFSMRKPGYLWYGQTISELGEIGAPDCLAVSLGLFFPVGLAGAILALFANAPPLSGLAASIAIGYLGAAFFPCDPGSPLQGTYRQTMHNLAGGVEYFGGAICLWKVAETQGSFFLILAILVVCGGVGLSVSQTLPIRGLIQRIAESALFLGLSLALWLEMGLSGNPLAIYPAN